MRWNAEWDTQFDKKTYSCIRIKNDEHSCKIALIEGICVNEFNSNVAKKPHTSKRRRRGSSTTSLTRFKNVTASLPSIKRWS